MVGYGSRVVPVVDRFVTGESSAAVRAAEGGDAIPAFTLRRTGEGGVNGRPTLVSNVETLAQLALLARLGAEGYRRLGTPDEAGTTLLTVHRGLGAEVVEVAYGTPLATVLGERRGGTGGAARRLPRHLPARVPRRDGGAVAGRMLPTRGRPWAPASWWCCRRAAARWSRPRRWSGSWPRSRRGSAGRACTACGRSPSGSPSWPTAAVRPRGWPSWTVGAGWFRVVAPAGTPTAWCGSSPRCSTAFPTEVAMHQHGSCGRPSRRLFPLEDAR